MVSIEPLSIAEHVNRRHDVTVLGLLFAGALLVRLAAVWIWRFDGLYGQDAFAYLGQAEAIAQGLPHGTLPPRDFFWPNGYPLLAAMAIWVLGDSVQAAQAVNLFCGAALPPLIYQLSRSLLPGAGRQAGLWAALIVLVAGQPILSSVVIMADSSALFWAAVAACLLVQAWPPMSADAPPHASALGLAGLVLGLAVVTRWIYGLLALPFAAYVLYQGRRGQWKQWRVLILPVVAGLSVVLPQVWLSLNRPESLLHEWLLNWRFANAFGRQFSSIDGDYTYVLPVALYYLQPLSHPSYMAPPLGMAALWGAVTLWRRRVWPSLILVGGWFAVFYLFLAGLAYENFRFALPLCLPAALLAGAGIAQLLQTPPAFARPYRNPERAYRIWRQGVYLVVLLCLAGMGLWAGRAAHGFLSTQNQSKQLAPAIAQTVPADATLLAFGLTLTLQHYTNLNVVEFYNLDEEQLDLITATATPLYLLLDLDNVERQWQARPPQFNYRWLQAHRILAPVAEFPPYTLFEVAEKGVR